MPLDLGGKLAELVIGQINTTTGEEAPQSLDDV